MIQYLYILQNDLHKKQFFFPCGEDFYDLLS